MNAARVNSLMCDICQKEFVSKSTKNRHIRTFHDPSLAEENKKKHIICTLCPNENREKFSRYNNLNEHMKNVHNLNIQESHFNFINFEEFEAWLEKVNRDGDYVCVRAMNFKGEKIKSYVCNRSDYRGYKSVCQNRARKTESKHIQGICPSRITVRYTCHGLVVATFVETHVGHRDRARAKRLSKLQEDLLVDKLAAGIPIEKIIQDARKTDGNNVQRINELTRGDLKYLARKYHLIKRRDPNDIADSNDESSSSEQYASISFEQSREIQLEEMNRFARALDEDTFNKFITDMWKVRSHLEENTMQVCEEVEVEEETFLPCLKVEVEEVTLNFLN